jgi:hypothetical protein
MALVSAHLDFGVDGNLHCKLADRMCPGCCVTYSVVGPYIVLESLKDASRVLGSPNPSYKQQPPPPMRVNFA